MTDSASIIDRLAPLVEVAATRLREGIAAHAPAVFTTSFGVEDMVVLDLIARHGLAADISTLDTGRLHEETYDLMDRARERYGRPILAFSPEAEALQAFVAREGLHPFYRSIELRQACCGIRKMEPLRRALAGHTLWITGLRREQSVTRGELPVLAHDDGQGLMKLNPIVEWTTEDVWDYVRAHDVPFNELHDRGFPSIGCAPCTRAIEPGEDLRAGRWWWENAATRECGLHVTPDGRLVRAPKADPIPDPMAVSAAGSH